jgi:hypothetical protein
MYSGPSGQNMQEGWARCCTTHLHEFYELAGRQLLAMTPHLLVVCQSLLPALIARTIRKDLESAGHTEDFRLLSDDASTDALDSPRVSLCGCCKVRWPACFSMARRVSCQRTPEARVVLPGNPLWQMHSVCFLDVAYRSCSHRHSTMS